MEYIYYFWIVLAATSITVSAIHHPEKTISKTEEPRWIDQIVHQMIHQLHTRHCFILENEFANSSFTDRHRDEKDALFKKILSATPTNILSFNRTFLAEIRKVANDAHGINHRCDSIGRVDHEKLLLSKNLYLTFAEDDVGYLEDLRAKFRLLDPYFCGMAKPKWLVVFFQQQHQALQAKSQLEAIIVEIYRETRFLDVTVLIVNELRVSDEELLTYNPFRNNFDRYKIGDGKLFPDKLKNLFGFKLDFYHRDDKAEANDLEMKMGSLHRRLENLIDGNFILERSKFHADAFKDLCRLLNCSIERFKRTGPIDHRNHPTPHDHRYRHDRFTVDLFGTAKDTLKVRLAACKNYLALKPMSYSKYVVILPILKTSAVSISSNELFSAISIIAIVCIFWFLAKLFKFTSIKYDEGAYKFWSFWNLGILIIGQDYAPIPKRWSARFLFLSLSIVTIFFASDLLSCLTEISVISSELTFDTLEELAESNLALCATSKAHRAFENALIRSELESKLRNASEGCLKTLVHTKGNRKVFFLWKTDHEIDRLTLAKFNLRVTSIEIKVPPRKLNFERAFHLINKYQRLLANFQERGISGRSSELDIFRKVISGHNLNIDAQNQNETDEDNSDDGMGDNNTMLVYESILLSGFLSAFVAFSYEILKPLVAPLLPRKILRYNKLKFQRYPKNDILFIKTNRIPNNKLFYLEKYTSQT